MTARASSSSPASRPSGTPPSARTRWRRAIRVTRRSRGAAGLAARPGGPAQGRLVRQAPHDRAFRLGLRIPQRVLSGYRRHRHGAAGALRGARHRMPAPQQACRKRALAWLLAMQSSDGGWAAFDADNNWEFLSHVPFADHNAMLDPTCPDITGRVLEALAAHGLDRNHPAVAARRGVAGAHIRSPTEAGTAAGAWPTSTAPASRCAAWRPPARATAKPTSCAPASGCAPSRTPMAAGAKAAPATTTASFTAAPSTPSQTAWAILGLHRRRRRRQPQRAARHRVPAAKRSAPTEAGTRAWPPGPGFPKVFYLNYHLYKDYFPLLALSSFVKARSELERITYEISPSR